jgi:hypothetical protein
MRLAVTFGPSDTRSCLVRATQRPRDGTFGALVEERHDLALEQVEQAVASMWSRRARSVSPSTDEMAQPLVPSNHSSHQPSRIEQLRPPLSAAFMPLVPHASCGRRGC